MTGEQEVVVSEWDIPGQGTWSLAYRPAGGDHSLSLLVNGFEISMGMGYDIPDVTEIGFSATVKKDEGLYTLYGLVTERIRTVRAEALDPDDWSESATVALPEALATDGTTLRSFVMLRPPVDNVTALVGLDWSGQVVQRIPFLGPFQEP